MNVKFLRQCILVLGFTFLSTASAEFKIIGYVVDWAGDQSPTLNFNQLTHVNYAFVTVGSGQGGINAPNDGLIRNLVTAAHAKNVKVLASIGGGGGNNDTYFHSIAANAGYRTTFINNCDAMLIKYNLDGIDIDWEYPEESPDPSTKNFTTLMSELAAKFHPKSKLVTAAVVGGSVGTYGFAIETAVFAVVDFLNIMAYDHAAVPHSGYDKSLVDLNFWKKRGLPKEKIILGVPFYGRNANYDGMNYKDIIAADPTAVNRDDYNGFYYNGVPTMQRKTRLAADSGGGIMFWESSLDTRSPSTSLLTAIYNARPITRVSPAIAAAPANSQIVQFQAASFCRGSNLLSMRISRPATVIVDVVNVKGQTVSTFVTHALEAGAYSIPLNDKIPSGTYYAGITAHAGTETQHIDKRIMSVK
jgi:GH18 family chitinase